MQPYYYIFFNTYVEFINHDDTITMPYVAGELYSDCYGLERIQLTPEDTVIDVGANIGMFSIYVKKKFGCRVISFEPVKKTFETFKENILLNGFSLDDFELHNCAITDKEGDFIKIGVPNNMNGCSTAFYDELEKNNIMEFDTAITDTLGKYIDDKCKFIKIDVEGGEYDILPTIYDKLSNVEHIGIEYHNMNNSQNVLELHKELRQHFNGNIFFTTNINEDEIKLFEEELKN